ncbi:MAG TPA: hypothetical protein VIL30_16700, partial [Ramlibacter sp.]
PTNPLYNAPRADRVRSSDRLWDAEVRLAEANEGPPAPEIGYEFSNGRRFRRGPEYIPLEDEGSQP